MRSFVVARSLCTRSEIRCHTATECRVAASLPHCLSIHAHRRADFVHSHSHIHSAKLPRYTESKPRYYDVHGHCRTVALSHCHTVAPSYRRTVALSHGVYDQGHSRVAHNYIVHCHSHTLISCIRPRHINSKGQIRSNPSV